MLSAVNSLRTEENAPLTNDSELKAKCADALNYVNADGTIPLGKARQQEDTLSADGKTRTIVAIGVETKGNYKFNSSNRTSWSRLWPSRRTSCLLMRQRSVGTATRTSTTV